MRCQTTCPTPLGPVTLTSNGAALTGLWFVGQKHYPAGLEDIPEVPDLAVFAQTRQWLADYFAGRAPGDAPPLCPAGTAFQKRVWALLQDIPYGQVRTYGELACALGTGSARAVGGAVGRNPVSLIIPCHRVVGAKGALTGYAGGLERKLALLRLEGALGPQKGS